MFFVIALWLKFLIVSQFREVFNYKSYLQIENRIWINGQSDWVGLDSDADSNASGLYL
jgi:hypothetical protein